MADQAQERVSIGSGGFFTYTKDDPVDTFFDWRAYFGEQMDTESNISENMPALTTASSVGTRQDDLGDEDAIMTDESTTTAADATPKPHRDQVLLGIPLAPDYPPEYPTTVQEDMLQPPSPGYPIHLPQPTKPQLLLGLGQHLAPPPPQVQKKPTRTVDAENTNKVRQTGACMACKVNRVKCCPGGTCQGCQKNLTKNLRIPPHKICNRRTPYDIVGGFFNRWGCLSTDPMPSNAQFTVEGMEVSVCFTETGQLRPPKLTLVANKFSMGNGQQGWGIISERKTTEDIQRWAMKGQSIDPSSIFQSAMDNLLTACVEEEILGSAAKASKFFKDRSNRIQPLRTCLEKLQIISRMRRLMQGKFNVQAKSPGLFGSHLQFPTIHGYLRRYAAEVISQCEKETLQEIDKLVAPSDIRPKNQHDLWSAVNVATWVSLWQLILLYQGVLADISSQPPTRTRDQSSRFRETTEELYDVIVVLLSTFFKTKATLQDLKGAGTGIFKDNNALRGAFEAAWSAHSEFYRVFEVRVPGDELVKTLIITKETEVLKRK